MNTSQKIIDFIEQCPQVLIVLDPIQIKRAIKVDDCLRVLFDMDEYLRQNVKYNDDPAFSDACEKVREKLRELMFDAGISLEELYA